MHIEEVKPEDLSVGFLKDFMDLPSSNEDGEDYRKYRKSVLMYPIEGGHDPI